MPREIINNGEPFSQRTPKENNNFEELYDLRIKTTPTSRYNQPNPPLNTEVDTLIDPANYPLSANLSFAIVVNLNSSGNNYVVSATVPIDALLNFPDMRYARSSEFEGVGGDANMAFWHDSTTNTIHYECDLDGGGKTIVVANVTTEELILIQ